MTEVVEVAGVVVHGRWKPRHAREGVRHALRNARHLRKLEAPVELEKEDWARRMQILLRRARHAANLARGPGAPIKLWPIELLQRRHRAILGRRLAFRGGLLPLSAAGRRRTRSGAGAHRVKLDTIWPLRFAAPKDDALGFLHDPDVPFSNKEAERDVRTIKLRQKISGGFRSKEGAADFATIRSFFAIARNRGCNIIEALNRGSETLVQALRLN